MPKYLLLIALSLIAAIQLSAMESVETKLTTDDLLDMDLEQLLDIEANDVYGATKTEQKSIDAPSSVSIVSAEDIRRLGYKTVGDAVASQSGFYTYYDRSYQYLGVRGFGRPGDYNTRILLMIDGQRINDNIYDTASVGTDFPLDMALIDHIEVIRGPGSALYGTNAFFAVINVITKDVADGRHGQITGEVGSFDMHKESFGYSKTFGNDMRMMVHASRYYSGGQDLYYKAFDTPESNNGIAENMDKEQYKNIFIKLAAKNVVFEVIMNKREKSNPTAAWEMLFNDPHAKMIDEHQTYRLKYAKDITKKWQLDAQVAYNRYDYYGSYPYDEVEEVVVYKDDTPGRWIDGNVDLKYQASIGNQWLFGAYYYKNLKQKLKYFNDDEIINEVEEKSDLYALYAQNIYDYSEKLSFTTGIRYDHYETFGDIVNPRFAAIWHMDELSVLKLLYGQAFRAPNIYERLYNDGEDTQKGNPNLNAEKIKTYELVLEHYTMQQAYMSATLFYYKIDNLITQVEDPEDELLLYRNIDKVESKGLEMNYRKRFKNGLRAGVNYTFAYSIDARTDTWMTNSPKHVANLYAAMPLADERFSVGATLQYNAKRKSPRGEMIDDFVVTNVTATGTDIVAKGLDMDISIYNLFDSRYASVVGEEHIQREIEQDGINGMIRLRYRF